MRDMVGKCNTSEDLASSMQVLKKHSTDFTSQIKIRLIGKPLSSTVNGWGNLVTTQRGHRFGRGVSTPFDENAMATVDGSSVSDGQNDGIGAQVTHSCNELPDFGPAHLCLRGVEGTLEYNMEDKLEYNLLHTTHTHTRTCPEAQIETAVARRGREARGGHV